MFDRETKFKENTGESKGIEDEVFREFERDIIRLVRDRRVGRIKGNVRDDAERLIDKYATRVK